MASANTNKSYSQLASIADQANRIHDVITTRLPFQHKLLAAEVAATKWLLSTLHKQHIGEHDHSKKCRLQLSNYRYRVLEQAERLTRLLCDLDLVESEGDEGIRKERKRLVVLVQERLAQADALKQTSDKLSAFYDTVLGEPAGVVVEPTTAAEEAPDNDMEEEDVVAESCPEETNNADEETAEMEMDETEEDPFASLPEWTPRHELREGPDGSIYLLANLAGVDMQNHLDVRVDGDVLRVSGVKLPTQREVHFQHMMRTPTFGRFSIDQTFPGRLFNLSEATVRRHPNGLVEVRVPRVARQRYMPSMLGRRRPTTLADMGLAW
ncbi:Aste57867_24793 [Aphanomyces stellatus]|uniref:Aste57867_24793 protein n=1 Tax=Aphanomyces stellatus TaxID=120398 RepID=A0A485LTG1_9STRA|nr:hypothetical protein As57867_024715 [Aphanomyces stellatus]VFU01428.1 Aste57867_24793 [Aphanomyces stellatus]